MSTETNPTPAVQPVVYPDAPVIAPTVTPPVAIVARGKSMKITFVQMLSTDREVFKAGEHYEVPVADAMRYLEAGVARKSIEPVATVVSNPPYAGPLTADEKVGTAADTNKAHARAVKPDADEHADNPGALVLQHGNGKSTVTPHGGTTTSNPSTKISPPSDGPSPLATNTVSATGGNATKK